MQESVGKAGSTVYRACLPVWRHGTPEWPLQRPGFPYGTGQFIADAYRPYARTRLNDGYFVAIVALEESIRQTLGNR
ncbi:hypothetical protein [Ruegeria sp. HKCCA0235A]|uniref:hypothetical protein n=1 Tax=Ruegeria sp. HKCCA0235A TaxID=2682998 RepID=UPI0014886E65|nr:hypothetical protein [Ruegeria sp. HKCCA0235A]